MNADEIEAALEEVFDQALVFHGYADYMRDYDLYVFAVADPRTGIAPEHLRYRFTHCVRATVASAVSREIWRSSLDERLTDPDLEVANQADGFVWGVRWQVLYPGMSLVARSAEADAWSRDLGLPFHEVTIETNAHQISLVFSDLVVTTADTLRRHSVVRGFRVTR